MIDSTLNGQKVNYIDAMRLQHSGVIVGESRDGLWVYVQSDQPGVKPAAWHFKVKKLMLPGVVVA